MKGKIVLVASALFVVVVLPVNAQTRVSPSANNTIAIETKGKQEEFKKRLQTIRDERKRLKVEKIDKKIANANKKSTSRFTAVLEKLQAILGKFSQRATIIKAKGGNTVPVDDAIKSAQKAIDSAMVAVLNQTAKEYTIQIGDESTLRSTVGATVSQFRQDLRDTHKAVVEAKQAVQKVGKEMNLLKQGGVRIRDRD